MKWIVRSLIGVVALALIAVVGAIWYVWSLGADLLARGKTAGWFTEAENTPLSVFEQTVANALFADTWNRSGFPCRTVSNGLTGARVAMPVSAFVARDILTDVAPELSLQAGLRRLSATCLLETQYSDTELLRLWLARLPISRHETAEAAAQALLGKSVAQLDEAESARLVALIEAPSTWRDPAKWDQRTQHILARMRGYVWSAEQLERADGATR